jgi:hypothetical protein
MSPGKIAVVAATFACSTLLSFGWSEQHGVSLSVERAQARDASAQTPKRVAAHSYRHNWRAAHAYSRNPVGAGADLAAGAVDTAGAVAAGAIVGAATSPFGGPYPGPGYYAGPAYYADSPWGDYECRAPHAYQCRPYASKDWSR